ncbi:Probable UDP-N-acetyl-D-mannosaminuronic acid transferase [Richelia intracellularis HH01]|uniref:Probable UDP-N-acetyl-D-mannosaminuronic acid transferase n=1 Tax=Richelia intracellularis HH01 TaxID=1165094 RepID=M1X0E3_9NOST|nr:Probable UDP-N-acetyl-D-mannosaminuronic acid transferase [Richelia intracellularis HH01]
MKSDRTFYILGLPINLMESYSTWILERLQQGSGAHIVTLNAEMTMQAQRNQSLATIIHNAELIIPDGAGIALYLTFMLHQTVPRIPGIELAEDLLQILGTQHKNKRVFFYGGVAGVSSKVAELWQRKLPGLNIVGNCSGYLSSEEIWELQQTLKQLQPDLVLVGLGVPRQELWISQNRDLCPRAIWIGVGGSFDIWCGIKNRAPQWLANNNLEWLYRLYQEPWRWQRMLALPEFAIKAFLYSMWKKLNIHKSIFFK